MYNKVENKYITQIQKILPYQIDIFLPEFKNTCHKNSLIALTNEKISSEDWFNVFKNRVLESINKKKFLPVCKFCDGELIFMNNGLEKIDYRFKLKTKIKILINNILIRLNLIKFKPFTVNAYTSGQYTYNEILSLNVKYKKGMKIVLENGILANSTVVSKNTPFTERFFKLYTDFMTDNKIEINSLNHVPYLFVYALFSGKSKLEIFDSKNVLIINSFNSDQKKIITNKLKSFGAKEIFYSNISSDRSAFDKLDIKNDQNFDLILIGAGVGKLLHFEYLSRFKVPCIDIGYIFQTWLEPNSSSQRAFCSSDDNYNETTYN